MKKLVISSLFFVFAINLFAQRSQSDLILKLLEDQRQAWNRGDLNGYMQGYNQSDSLLFVGKSGPQYGWNNTLKNYKKSYPNKSAMGYLSFDIKEIKMIAADHAFVLGAWHLKRENDEPKGYFTLLVKKIKGQWKVIADHSS
ncbi:nuclear transport factor 2 family protein [Daejeonella sp.]|uniref:YybH family protein n=1 Tax=Daejeonella sp. TaxID=2805397 RepID=UPI0027BB2092|nr:nuclear transport factor 2 family protein [Daejeonella sp.]